MRALQVRSTPTHYVVEIERRALGQEPTILKDADRAVAVVLPVDDYRAFEQWRQQQQSLPPSMPPDFADEVAAFERLKPALQKDHAGQVVAIYQGQVVAVGDDKMAVLGQVLDKYGPISCYIEWVESESPRQVRLPSAWISR